MTQRTTRAQRKARIGLIGFGGIGRQVYQRVMHGPPCGLEIAFVHNRTAPAMAAVPQQLQLQDLAQFAERGADLVIEMAHPAYTQRWGAQILSAADYMPLSVSALADDALREQLLAAAGAAGTSLAIPHGALMGLDSLREWRAQWSEVVISFFKNPANIDFSDSGMDPAGIQAQTVLYDGPTRGIAPLFPRNINTMITCALATTGLDACRARLVADPGLDVAIAEVTATGRDGSRLTMRKEQPAVGVSGTEMFASQFASIQRAAAARETLAFV
jgi:predicted dinucleotide-utilizing enzyme